MTNVIKVIKPLGFPWVTQDPFLFCVFHEDLYPNGDGQLAPADSFSGRNIGNDFSGIDGWRMYHGNKVPGFPAHPHRGFETVTIVNKGWVDHADSKGGSGRFGNGDVQWMTAGKGIQHSEMFPLLEEHKENPLEMFQIWLNLPRANKMVEPHYKMLWGKDIPHLREPGVTVQIVAGKLRNLQAVRPAPNSWAEDTQNQVAIWNIKLAANSRWIIPAAAKGLNRSLYFFEGSNLDVDGQYIKQHCAIEINEGAVQLISGDQSIRLLLLQGRPIGEPVVQYGPFVMNTQDEIRQAIEDYQNDQYGGWPWPTNDPTHGVKPGRFAKHIGRNK